MIAIHILLLYQRYPIVSASLPMIISFQDDKPVNNFTATAAEYCIDLNTECYIKLQIINKEMIVKTMIMMIPNDITKWEHI